MIPVVIGLLWPWVGKLPFGRLQQPKVEAEVALILSRDLDLPDCTVADLYEAVAWVVPAIVGSLGLPDVFETGARVYLLRGLYQVLRVVVPVRLGERRRPLVPVHLQVC